MKLLECCRLYDFRLLLLFDFLVNELFNIKRFRPSHIRLFGNGDMEVRPGRTRATRADTTNGLPLSDSLADF